MPIRAAPPPAAVAAATATTAVNVNRSAPGSSERAAQDAAAVSIPCVVSCKSSMFAFFVSVCTLRVASAAMAAAAAVAEASVTAAVAATVGKEPAAAASAVQRALGRWDTAVGHKACNHSCRSCGMGFQLNPTHRKIEVLSTSCDIYRHN